MAKVLLPHLAGPILIEDPDGTDLPDLTAAVAEATADVRMLISDRIPAGTAIEAWAVEVTDAAGMTFAAVHSMT